MEVEIKAKIGNPDEIRRILKDMGVRFEGEVHQKDFYFNHPCRDFASTDEALRIRISGDIRITYKGPKVDSETKSREEIEFGVESYEKAVEMLKRLGFVEAGIVEKIREIYSLNDVEISIDDVLGLGYFVELEIQGENTEENRERLFSLGKELGLDEYMRESYLELILKNEG